MVLLSVVYDPVKFPIARLGKELEVGEPLAFYIDSVLRNRYSLYTGDTKLAHMLATMLLRIAGMYHPHSDPSTFYMVDQREKIYEEWRKAWDRGVKTISKTISERGSQ